MTLRTGIVLFVIGAILAFAIRASLPGVDLTMVGYILMIGGGVAFVVGLFLGQWGGWDPRGRNVPPTPPTEVP